jgi:biofilm PGA synthesis lipoprotein PgaB
MKRFVKSLLVLIIFTFIFVYTYAYVEPRADINSREEFNPETKIYYKDAVIVLTYHVLDPKILGPISLSPKLFEDQMEYLRYMGFHFITPYLLEKFMEGKEDVPPNAILITFDDGYESFYKFAFPILKRYKIPAINFVIVSMIGKKGAFPHLTWDEMKIMEKSGLIYFGSHSYDSHYLIRTGIFSKAPALIGRKFELFGYKESEAEYESRISFDLWYSKTLLERNLNITVDDFCFPYGAYNSKVLEIAKKVGYKVFYTTEKGINKATKSAYILIKRINAGNYKMTVKRLENILSIYFSKNKSTVSIRPKRIINKSFFLSYHHQL